MTERSSPQPAVPHAARPHPIRNLFDFVVYTVRRFLKDGLSESAASLTYSTLLALVPLVVIAFAVMSSFSAFDGVTARLERMFLDAIVPEVGVEIQGYFELFTSNARNLTAAGTVALAMTALLLLSNIESALNKVWRVQRPRAWGSRILIYWAVLTLGPLLLALSISMSSDVAAELRRWAGDGEVIDRIWTGRGVISLVLAVLTQTLAFTLLYKLVPACSVKLMDAAIGGLVAAVVFVALRWWFNSYVTSGTTYQTIYGAVAILPLFLVWLYACWTVIIMGALVAAALPDWWNRSDPSIAIQISPALRLQLAVAVLSILAGRARSGLGTHPDDLKGRILVDAQDEVVDRLLEKGYLAVTEAGHLVLVRDMHSTTLGTLVDDLDLLYSKAPLDEDAEPDSRRDTVLARVARLSGTLPQRLAELSAAETRALDCPLSEILAADPEAAE